jgi:hypothetical protein
MIMSKPNYRQIYAIEKKNKERVLKVNPYLQDRSGIYFLTRIDEDGIGYFYIGQASVSVLGRVAQHLSGYQHIDLSLKKRGLYDEKDNPYGWKINALYYPENELDKWEQYWILEYTKQGYQCRYNKTAGGQGAGKEKINEYRESRGYRDGLRQGYKNASKEISHLFDLHLEYKAKSSPPTKNQQKALSKFNDFLNFYNDNNQRKE